MSAAALAAAAKVLVGTPFRLHGRDRATGLDCIGVLAAALAASGQPAALPNFYALRMRTLPELGEAASRAGLTLCTGKPLPGDVVLVRTGPCQFHVLIAVGDGGFVHAHAGLRRVVQSALPTEWQMIRHWRLTQQD